MRVKLLTLLVSVAMLAACSSTSTPDLTLIMILYCGDDGNACRMHDDNQCAGRGRFNDLGDDRDIVIENDSGKQLSKHEMDYGQFDDVNNTCMFSETISMQSTSRYNIFIGDFGPYQIMKSALEDQNWTAVWEFNN